MIYSSLEDRVVKARGDRDKVSKLISEFKPFVRQKALIDSRAVLIFPITKISEFLGIVFGVSSSELLNPFFRYLSTA